MEKINIHQRSILNHSAFQNDKIELRSFNAGKVDVNTIDIIRIEASKSYSVFYLKDNRKFISSHNLSYQVKKLNSNFFFRTGKSFLINMFHIENVTDSTPVKLKMRDGFEVQISRRKTAHFMAMYKLYQYEVNK